MYRDLAVCLLALLTLSSFSAQASTPYQMTWLGFLPGDGYSSALDISSTGQVLGWSVSYNDYSNDTRGAFLWNHASGMIDIQTEGQFDSASDINNNNLIAGTGIGVIGPTTAVLREADGTLKQLAPLTEGSYVNYAYALNDAGWVVGTSAHYAVLWQGSATPQAIGGSPTSDSYAVDINNSGSIAWHESLYENYPWIGGRSYVWNAGVNTLLQTLNIGDNCQVEAINDAGIAVGSSNDHAVVWDSNGSVVRDLGLGSRAYGISNSGLIVGTVNHSAWLWSLDGTISLNLGSLAGLDQPSEAWDINDSGLVVGAAGYDQYQNMEAVLWEPVPVPEPSSLLALAGGFASLAAVVGRRRS